MAENTDPAQTPGSAENNEAPAAPAAPAGPRLRDRMWTFRSLLAVGIASLLLGGAGGAALVAATGDDHDRDQHRMGRWNGPGGPGGFDGRGPGMMNGYGQQRGPQQLPQQGTGGGVPQAPSTPTQ